MVVASPKLRAVSRDPAAELTDAELVRRLADGEAWAARAIWDKFQPGVHGFLRRALGTSDVEDATQEVFLRFFKGFRGLEDPSALGSFIFSMAVRVMRWQLRKRWVRRIMHLSNDPPEPLALPADAEARAALLRLYERLDEVGTDDRTLFVLRRIEELSVVEIAEVLGVSLATAKRRVNRACARVSRIALRDPLLTGYFEGLPHPEQDAP